ncbi:MAG TPA: porin [Kofleriaceae bacterium]
MNRQTLSAALVLLLARVAGAQPAPTEPAPAPADQAQPPTTPPAPVEATPPVEAPPPEVKPEEPKKDDKPAVTAKYDGGLKFESDDGQYEMKLSFRNQVRFESNRSLDDETDTRHNQFLNNFYIVRARLQAEGYLFGKDNRYKVETGFGDSGSFSFLKDLYLEKRLPDSPIYVRMGQWKRPFNRAELVSDFASTFNERSIENELAGGGRSQGIALHNDYEKSPEGLGWIFGVFNTFSGGNDRPAISTACTSNAMTGVITCVNTRPSNFPTDFGPTLVARADWNSAKIKGYSESDLEGGPMRYSIGGSYKVDLANLNKQAKASWGDNMSHGLELDANIKAMGYSLTGGVVLMKIKDADADFGFYLQPAMMVIPKHAELALRFALITVPGTNAAMEAIHRNQTETRLAFNYYFHGHTWKFASDVGFLKLTGEDNGDGGDFQLRAMLQMQI